LLRKNHKVRQLNRKALLSPVPALPVPIMRGAITSAARQRITGRITMLRSSTVSLNKLQGVELEGVAPAMSCGPR
jgi:hypothetical protein